MMTADRLPIYQKGVSGSLGIGSDDTLVSNVSGTSDCTLAIMQ